jgi:hypothetical protein
MIERYDYGNIGMQEERTDVNTGIPEPNRKAYMPPLYAGYPTLPEEPEGEFGITVEWVIPDPGIPGGYIVYDPDNVEHDPETGWSLDENNVWQARVKITLTGGP